MEIELENKKSRGQKVKTFIGYLFIIFPAIVIITYWIDPVWYFVVEFIPNGRSDNFNPVEFLGLLAIAGAILLHNNNKK